MSLEAFGDEGNVPANMKDTQLYHEAIELGAKLRKFMMLNLKEWPNEEIKAKFCDAVDLWDEAEELLGSFEL